MFLTERQEKIIDIVKKHGPITGEHIAKKLNLTRATLRPDLSILTRSGILEARPRVGYSYNGNSSLIKLANQLHKIRVRDFKSLPVVVGENTTVYNAAVKMFTEDVGTLFVVDQKGNLQGVISRKDLLKTTLGNNKDVQQLPVNVIMTRMPNIITTTNDETVYLAAKKIVDHEVDALPVVRTFIDSQGVEHFEVVGRVTKTNLAKILVELGEGK
ncbi:MAG: helix-turn-helix transcriptional regulator [Clostridia bacterium]|nr:helix-turn-helix transcriptional regulator [Clostridia bacterium]